MGMDCHATIRFLFILLSPGCTPLQNWLRLISRLMAWRVFPPVIIVRLVIICLVIIIGHISAVIVRPIRCITVGIIRLLTIIIGSICSTIIVIGAVIFIICPLIRLGRVTFTMTTTLVVVKLDILEFVHRLKVIHTRRRIILVLMLVNDLFGRLDGNLFATGPSNIKRRLDWFFLLLHSLSHKDRSRNLPLIHRPLNRPALLSHHLTTIIGTLLTN
mmetsp:Transcript_13992/g.23808  ORF Transcript_13992/g.23808 Transcript_13992/m.23808 type:complete len:216 (+) Transcript_13992:1391-2038(+)